MKVEAATHLFGSVRGYTTLAHSDDLSRVEIEELEVLSFGQTGDPHFLSQLVNEPSAFGRPLRSGRFAITRCFAGEPDDAGRPTLQLRTIVVDAQQYEAVCLAGLESVVRSRDIWQSESFNQGRCVRAHTKSSGKRAVNEDDLRIFDAWLTARDTGAIAVLQEGYCAQQNILALTQVLSPEDRIEFRWGIRMLGTGAPIDVGTIAPGGSRAGRRRVIDMPMSGRWRNEGVAHLAAVLSRGGLDVLPPRTSVVGRMSDDLRSGSSVSAGRQHERVAAPHHSLAIKRKRRLLVTASLAASMVLLGSVGFATFLSLRPGQPAPTAAQAPTTLPDHEEIVGGKGAQWDIDDASVAEPPFEDDDRSVTPDEPDVAHDDSDDREADELEDETSDEPPLDDAAPPAEEEDQGHAGDSPGVEDVTADNESDSVEIDHDELLSDARVRREEGGFVDEGADNEGNESVDGEEQERECEADTEDALVLTPETIQSELESLTQALGRIRGKHGHKVAERRRAEKQLDHAEREADRQRLRTSIADLEKEIHSLKVEVAADCRHLYIILEQRAAWLDQQWKHSCLPDSVSGDPPGVISQSDYEFAQSLLDASNAARSAIREIEATLRARLWDVAGFLREEDIRPFNEIQSKHQQLIDRLRRCMMQFERKHRDQENAPTDS